MDAEEDMAQVVDVASTRRIAPVGDRDLDAVEVEVQAK